MPTFLLFKKTIESDVISLSLVSLSVMIDGAQQKPIAPSIHADLARSAQIFDIIMTQI